MGGLVVKEDKTNVIFDSLSLEIVSNFIYEYLKPSTDTNNKQFRTSVAVRKEFNVKLPNIGESTAQKYSSVPMSGLLRSLNIKAHYSIMKYLSTEGEEDPFIFRKATR